MMEHEKALRIFVYSLKDIKAAETYCNEMTAVSSSTPRQKEQLLLLYLTVLLDSTLTRWVRKNTSVCTLITLIEKQIT